MSCSDFINFFFGSIAQVGDINKVTFMKQLFIQRKKRVKPRHQKNINILQRLKRSKVNVAEM